MDYSIVEKYNKLLDEVIEYYSVPNIELFRGIHELNTFTISNPAGIYVVDIIINKESFKQANSFLIGTYPYLVPFFHLYSSLLSFIDTNFSPIYLKKINIVMKKIRKENDNNTYNTGNSVTNRNGN